METGEGFNDKAMSWGLISYHPACKTLIIFSSALLALGPLALVLTIVARFRRTRRT